MDSLILSKLNHTWFIDIDGTICKHNGYLIDGVDTILPGVVNFFNEIPENDIIILITSRKEKHKEITQKFLKEYNIRYDKILFNIPTGERILINDIKPNGLLTSLSINHIRNNDLNINIIVDENI